MTCVLHWDACSQCILQGKELTSIYSVAVINLCFAGLLLGFVSGVFMLLVDEIQIIKATELGHCVKVFIEELAINVYFQALFLIRSTRYSLLQCGRKLARMTVEQTTALCITISWLIANFSTLTYQDKKHVEFPCSEVTLLLLAIFSKHDEVIKFKCCNISGDSVEQSQ